MQKSKNKIRILKNDIKKQKKWYGNNTNGTQTAKRNYTDRRINYPVSVFNIEGKPMSNTNNNEKNNIERSIKRVRAGGAMVSLKVTNNNS